MLCKRLVAFALALLLVFSASFNTVFAEDTSVTETKTYVLNRDGNGENLYLYQSPCMLGYDLNNKYGGNGVPIQAFVYTMYNSITGEHFPTYCGDINVTAVQGTDYRRLNLEDSPFSANSAGKIRAILQEGFYLLPISGESDADHAARVSEKTSQLARAAGVDGLTTGEAIAATQAAIWQVVHGQELSFPKFCRYVFNPTNTKYASLCSYSDLRYKNNDLINSTIESVYKYLTSLAPVKATEKTVSASSFVELNNPVLTKNADGTYNISVVATVDVDMVEGDTLAVTAKLNDTYVANTNLVNGEQVITLTLEKVPESVANGDITLSISGYQTSKGYFYFDAEGARGASQTMVGYNNSRLPVYAEVEAKEDRILNIVKTAKVPVGNDAYENKALSNIAFDIFPVATMDEYLSGAVTLPEATEYVYPTLADYTLITDENGKASFNFLHNNLPDGVYLVVEHPHPSIVAPIKPFYITVPMNDPETGEPVYEITVKPKNEVRGGVYIEKDVITVGNDEASVNAYESHRWIIGSTVPSDISSGVSYVITDTLDNRLDYLGNLSVVLEKNGEDASVTLIEGTDYTLTVTDVDSLSEDKPSDSLKIALTGIGMLKIADAVGSNDFNSYMLRVYFDARINANALMGEKIPNRSEIEYVNAVNFKFTEQSDIPVVYTGGVNLKKVDAKNTDRALTGATFELYRAATADELAANDPRLTALSGVSGKVIKVSFFKNDALNGDKVDFVVSGADGKAVIYGIAYGTYYLVETKAPDGYNLLSEPQKIVINEISHLEENTITVKNSTGTILPGTGDIGTKTFTAVGVTLMCAAVLMLFVKTIFKKIREV